MAGSNCGRDSGQRSVLTVIWIRPGAFGAGDVKLMAISGLMLGVGRNLTAFGFATAFSGIILSAGDIAQR